MHLLIPIAALLFSTAFASPPSKRATTLIPKSVFDSTANLEQYFNYNYPWGTDHNGGARMDKSHARISSPGVLTISAQPVTGQPPTSHGGQQIPINYLSGAINAKQQFTVPTGGGLVFSASFQATTTKGTNSSVYAVRSHLHGLVNATLMAAGTWPAFWLTAVSGWPPEIDMAEWKGSGKISFNTFNTSSSVSTHDINYPNPGQWHDIRCQVRDHGNGRVQVKYFMDGTEITTHYGQDYMGKAMYLIVNLQMEGSSGSPGPSGNTEYSVRGLEVKTL